jgi:DNA polymerase III epsilon subunit-like protein
MKRDIIVFDFETGGRNKLTCQPTQIAAIALDGRNFRPKGEFVSYMRPIIDDDEAIAAGVGPLEEGALKVTGQTRELLAKAPLPKAVWESFCEFVNRYNWKGTQFFAPIPCGYNIMGFDMPIVNRLCKQYNMYVYADSIICIGTRLTSKTNYLIRSIRLMLWMISFYGQRVILMLNLLVWMLIVSDTI